jgi:signal recognition particle GTPase
MLQTARCRLPLKNRGRIRGAGSPALVALTGMGGTGKTQLAAQYAEKFRGQYRVVWWLAAEEPAAAQRDLGELARRLKCDFHDDPNPAVRANSAMEWLKSNDDWLLVMDNILGVDAATDLIPEGGLESAIPGQRTSQGSGDQASSRSRRTRTQ